MNPSNPIDSMKSALLLVENSLNLAALSIALTGLYLFQTLIG